MDVDEDLYLKTENTEIPLTSISLWDDVEPIIQNDGPHSVVNIAYTPSFRQSMDFFRAVVLSKEISRRVFALMKRIIELNPANYTAWHIRRLCLFELQYDLQQELDYIEEAVESSPKNYQIWYHRRALIEHIGDGTNEPSFVARVFDQTDSKNYHAWAHRQWAVRTFNLWEGELEYSDFMIREDVRNNSAWNHRYFALTKGNTMEKIDFNLAKSEFNYLTEKAELAPSNECPYNYLRGIAAKSDLTFNHELVLSWLVEMEETVTSSAVALRSVLVDALVEASQKADAVQLCTALAERYDPIRKSYWEWRAAGILT